MPKTFHYQPFRNILFSVVASYIDRTLHELLQLPMPTVVSSMQGVLLQSPPVVLTGRDLHQPDVLNPNSLNVSLQSMGKNIDKKIHTLQSIQLDADHLPPGLVYLLRALLDPYQRLMFITTDPHSGEKSWEQLIKLIETDPYLKSLVEHYLCNDEQISIRHYKRLLRGFVASRSISNAVKSYRLSENASAKDANQPTNVEGGEEVESAQTSVSATDIQTTQPTSNVNNGALTPRSLIALMSIKKTSGVH